MQIKKIYNDRPRSDIYDILMWKRGWRSKNYVNPVVWVSIMCVSESEREEEERQRETKLRGVLDAQQRLQDLLTAITVYDDINKLKPFPFIAYHVCIIYLYKGAHVCMYGTDKRHFVWSEQK